MTEEFDIVIVGGGIVGLTTANLLSKNKSLNILIIEKNEFDSSWQPDSLDIRTSAINRASENILREIGTFQQIPHTKTSDYIGMEVWDYTNTSKIDFNATDILQKNLGYILENREIQKVLWQQTNITDNIQVFYATIEQIEITEDNAFLTVCQDTNVAKKISSKLIVGADGANSMVRKYMGFDKFEFSYEQRAVVANIKTELPHNKIARQKFLQTGPLAFLPLKESNTSAIVWSMGVDDAEKFCNMPEQEFNKTLQEVFDYSLGDTKVISKRLSFPLKLMHAKSYCKSRVVLVGDAAHVIHPLAGQGLNLGLIDAKTLADTLLIALRMGKTDLGQKNILRKYERSRKGHNVAVQSAMSFFKGIFANDLGIVRQLRTTGINFLNNTKLLKDKAIKIALGV